MARTTTNFGFSSTATEVLEGVDLGGKRAIVTGGASDRQKLKGDRVLLMRTELRINHLSKSAMYKIVQSTSVILQHQEEAKSAAYLASRSSNARALTGISH
jgi:hypothetical protein